MEDNPIADADITGYSRVPLHQARYVGIFQVMPITRELLSKKLDMGTDGIHWLMEYFYTHDDNYNLIASRPFATL